MANNSSASSPSGSSGVSVRSVILLLVLSNMLVYQFASLPKSGAVSDIMGIRSSTGTSTSSSASTGQVIDTSRYALEVPPGEAKALPSVRISDEESDRVGRKFYGGKGDKAHLGGFTEIDVHGLSPTLWKDMVEYFGIKSVLDVGCGRGLSTSWFVTHGLDTLCVEGSHDAVERTMLPDPSIVTEHDFSRGPWWPGRTVDAVWSVEFLEHVGRNFHQNYIPAFRKAALIFVTSSRWGGWHHVEVHWDDWWIARMQSFGFVYSESLTERARNKAREDRGKGPLPTGELPAFGNVYNPQHVYTSMKVFINPAVASLPEHQHLLAELGCYVDRKDNEIIRRVCGTGKGKGIETPLPEEYMPLRLTDDQDKAWFDLVKKNVNASAT